MSAWQNSTRRDRLPPDWERTRKRIGKRDDWSCQWRMADGFLCGREAREVDHIKAGDDHSDRNLQCLCAWHHHKKSGGEGARAVAVKRKAIRQKYVRSEEHPGLL